MGLADLELAQGDQVVLQEPEPFGQLSFPSELRWIGDAYVGTLDDQDRPRPARPGERPVLVRFMASLNEVESAYQPDRALGEAAADSHLAYLEGLVESQEGFITVAESDDGLVGFLVAMVEAEDGTYIVPEARCFGYVSDIFVAPPARGRGVARALMADAEARFRAMGLNTIRVCALVDNKVAVGAYEALGYAPMDVLMKKDL